MKCCDEFHVTVFIYSLELDWTNYTMNEIVKQQMKMTSCHQCLGITGLNQPNKRYYAGLGKPIIYLRRSDDQLHIVSLIYEATWDIQLRPRRNGNHFPDDIFKFVFLI